VEKGREETNSTTNTTQAKGKYKTKDKGKAKEGKTVPKIMNKKPNAKREGRRGTTKRFERTDKIGIFPKL